MLAVLAAMALAAGSTAAPCRTVHGRMMLANGAPAVRIRPDGGRRLLGVVQPHEAFSDLPTNVRTLWNAQGDEAMWRTDLVGDFEVCAVTPSRPGRMQRIELR